MPVGIRKPLSAGVVSLCVLLGGLAFASAPVFASEPLEALVIESESSSGVDSTEARLEAVINPGNSETAYHFEYGSAAGSYDVSIPAPDAHIRAGLAGTSVSVAATDLQPGTAFHYRVVASNALPGVVDGPDHEFTTPAAQGLGSPPSCPNEQRRAEQPYGLKLPDCRAYEIVSPLESKGQDATDSFLEEEPRASVSGEAVTYASRGSFDEAKGETINNRFVSRRGPGGWSTQNITPLHDAFQTETFPSYQETAFTPELTEGIASTNAQLTSEAPAAQKGLFGLYQADFASGSYRYVGPGFDASGSSEDLSRILFGEGGLVFEFVNGKVVPVSVTNGGESMNARAGSESWYINSRGENAWHAVSADGSRVYFTSPEYYYRSPAVVAPGVLYVRENAEREQSELGTKGECVEPAMSCTVEVSVSQKTNGSGPNGAALNGGGTSADATAHYWGASANGSKVFFTSDQELTNDANTGASHQQEIVAIQDRPEIFQLTFKGQTTVPLSTGDTPAEVQSALEALSSIGAGNVTVSVGYGLEYPGAGFSFLVTFDGALAGSEQPSMASSAEDVGVRVPGDDLYEYDLESGKLNDLSADAADVDGAGVMGVVQISEDGSYVYFVADGDLEGKAVARQPNLYVSHDGGAPRFIATLSAGDSTDWHGFSSSGVQGEDRSGPEINTAVVSPSGDRFAFMSEERLTGYDNEQAEPGECETGNCQEIFLYDAETGGLACASCNPSGARPVGPSSFTPEAEPSLGVYRPRNLLEDGSLFFDSSDALVPHASDGRQNVYEYEAGHVYAISDVAGGYESFFMDASADGENVFFGTADQLLPEDTSNNVVVWDARVGGGFPVTVVPAPCENGDSCKPPPTPQPGVFGAPSSATFSGPGNIAPVAVVKPAVKAKAKPVKCKRGEEKKKGKCMRKPKSKKKAHKSTDRKGSK